MTHSLILLNKSCDDKALQIDIFINELDNLDNTTLLCAFLLVLILNQSYHQTHIADEVTYIIAKAYLKQYQSLLPILFPSSQLFFLLHDKHFETNEKISNRIDASNTPFYNLSTGMMGWMNLELHLMSLLLFVHYSAIKLRYFW